MVYATMQNPVESSSRERSEKGIKHQSGRGLISNGWVAGLMLAPASIAYVLMILLPTFAVLLLAFTDYEFGAPSFRWIGLGNFSDMLSDSTFSASIAIRSTIVYSLCPPPLSLLWCSPSSLRRVPGAGQYFGRFSSCPLCPSPSPWQRLGNIFCIQQSVP
jgi:hypothetical protein